MEAFAIPTFLQMRNRLNLRESNATSSCSISSPSSLLWVENLRERSFFFFFSSGNFHFMYYKWSDELFKFEGRKLSGFYRLWFSAPWNWAEDLIHQLDIWHVFAKNFCTIYDIGESCKDFRSSHCITHFK